MPNRLQISIIPRAALWSTLAFFLCLQALGLLLRFQFVQAIPGVHFAFFLHTHSHVALLGWVHALLLLLLPRAFVDAKRLSRYHKLFWASQACVVGMLLSFPFQGYGPVSITFSTLSLFVNYAFAYALWRDTRDQRSTPHWLLRFALILLVLSSLGPWGLGPTIALKLKDTPLYPMLIYFYLHFMYNGWFVLGGLAYVLRKHVIGKDEYTPALEKSVRILAWATLPGFALSALWLHPPVWVWLLAAIGAALPLGALGIWLNSLSAKGFASVCGKLFKSSIFWGISCLAFIGKLLLQAMTALPYFAHMAAAQRPLVIFYLHWVFLGVLSFFFLGELTVKQKLHGRAKSGAWLLISGVALSEALLLLQGLLNVWPVFRLNAYPWLFGVSLLMPLGSLLLLPQLWLSGRFHETSP